MAEVSKGGIPSRGESTPTKRKEASVPRKRKSTGVTRGEKSRGRRGSVPYTGRSAARIEDVRG